MQCQEAVLYKMKQVIMNWRLTLNLLKDTP